MIKQGGGRTDHEEGGAHYHLGVVLLLLRQVIRNVTDLVGPAALHRVVGPVDGIDAGAQRLGPVDDEQPPDAGR